MKRLPPAQGALPFTFFVYVVEALIALACALPLGLELNADLRASLADPSGRAVWLDRVPELIPVLRAQGGSAALFGLLWLALSPWLQMAWLYAIARPSGTRGALAQGARLYFRAWRVSLWVIVLLALACLPLGAALPIALWAFSEQGEEQLHDLALAAAAGALLLLLWTAHVLHDLARAHALSLPAWRAVRASLRSCFRPRVQATALAFWLAALALRGTQLLVAALGAELAGAGAVALLQAACFAALLARGAWLARALACAGEIGASRDPS
jgi:hypothetical protein